MPTAVNNPASAQATANALADASKKKNKAQLDPDDFMTLFIAQLKHQNPLQPSDSSALLQQMSEISQISASKDMQKTMKDLSQEVNMALSDSQILSATQLIGKNVVLDSKLGVSPLTKEGLDGSVILPEKASNIVVTIKDPTNSKVITTIDLKDAASNGLKDFHWGGEGFPTEPVEFYHISATAMVNGKQVSVPIAGSFKVKSVAPGTEGVIINMDGIGGKNMGEIIKIL